MYKLEHPDFYIDVAKYDDEIVIYASALSHAQDHFANILHHIYSDEKLDIDSFENSLDEVAYTLKMKLPKTDPKIQRSEA
jgi:hypothetical protein